MPMFPISHFGGSIYQTKQYVINLLSSMGFDSSSYKIVCINSYVQVGEYLVQNFKILSKKKKKVKLDSYEYYITSYLLIDGKWKCLWPCREFTDKSNISILERHIEEANLD